MTTFVETPDRFAAYVGMPLGTSDWVVLDQSKIDAFAALTGDDHWIHVDVPRASQELPDGKTLVHGFLTLSLIPFLQRTVFQVAKRGKGLNYGCNRVRFTSPLQVGARVRLHQSVKACERVAGGSRITFDCTIEVEGQDKPALVAETMLQMSDC
jgi:acyl dehydratase